MRRKEMEGRDLGACSKGTSSRRATLFNDITGIRRCKDGSRSPSSLRKGAEGRYKIPFYPVATAADSLII
jgi:hypothetical protein